MEAEAPYRLTYANPAWEQLVGKDWRAVAGQPCLDVLQVRGLGGGWQGSGRGLQAQPAPAAAAGSAACVPLPGNAERRLPRCPPLALQPTHPPTHPPTM